MEKGIREMPMPRLEPVSRSEEEAKLITAINVATKKRETTGSPVTGMEISMRQQYDGFGEAGHSEPAPPTLREAQIINLIRSTPWGEIIITMKDGKPVRARTGKDHKLGD